MKNLSRILSIVLAFITFYLFLQAQVKLDLVIAFCCMLMAIIFLLFSIMEEQKEDVEALRKVIRSYQKSVSRSTSPLLNDLEHIGFRSVEDGATMNIYKDGRGRRWFSIARP